MTQANLVNIEGLGEMVKSFYVSYDGINIDDPDSGTTPNHHLENVPSFSCETEHDYFFLANDTIRLQGSQTASGGYQLSVMFDTDSQTPLYNSGNVILNYDAQTQNWRMSAVADNKVWRFCDTGAVIDTIIAGIDCYCSSSDSNVDYCKSLTNLRNSIVNDRQGLDASSIMYAFASDCSQQTETGADTNGPAVTPKALGRLSDAAVPSSNTSSVTTGQTVFIDGLGELPSSFSLFSDQVNMFISTQPDTKDQIANGHLETNLVFACEEETGIQNFLNDTVEVQGLATDTGGYELTLSFASECRMPLANDGSLTLNFDPSTKKWHMAGVADFKPWRFCSAEASVDWVNNALTCLGSQQPEYIAALQLLAGSLANQKEAISQTALPYLEKGDCSVTVIRKSETVNDSEIYTTYPW